MARRYFGVCFLSVALVWGCGSTNHQGSTGTAGSGAGAGTSGTTQATGGKSQGDSGAAGSADVEQGGASNKGGATLGGTNAGGAKGGCTGPLEEMQSGLCVAKMVKVPAGYSIDATEVTRLQYQTWLATSPAADPTCMPKTSPSYEPDPKCVGELMDNRDDLDHLPQVCIDWCDAVAYCKGVGKRLCGKIGGGGLAAGEFKDAASSQWFNACSSGGVNVYPYGNTHSPAACNGYDNPTSDFDVMPVGSLSTCQSPVDGYQGIFDMSGNVHEWEDSCTGTGNERGCNVRGGSVVSMLECAAEGAGFMTNPGQDNFGLRCCKDE